MSVSGHSIEVAGVSFAGNEVFDRAQRMLAAEGLSPENGKDYYDRMRDIVKREPFYRHDLEVCVRPEPER